MSLFAFIPSSRRRDDISGLNPKSTAEDLIPLDSYMCEWVFYILLRNFSSIGIEPVRFLNIGSIGFVSNY